MHRPQGMTILAIFAVMLLVPSAQASSERSNFFVSTEIFGPDAYTDPAAAGNYQNGLANMVGLWAPVDQGRTDFITSRNVGFNLNMQGGAVVDGNSASYIANNSQAAASLCAALGPDK